MSILDLIRKARAKVKAQRNGHADPQPAKVQSYAINAINAVSPPLHATPRLSTGPHFQVVHDPSQLESPLTALDDVPLVALDTETTGLNSRADRVRLLSLAVPTIDEGRFCYLVDCSKVDPSPLWERLAGKDLVLHNAAFDLGFLFQMGFIPAGKVHDTMILAQLLTAGTREPNKLGDCCRRYLGQSLDKTEQRSDWSAELSAEQLGYAARDVEVLAPLLGALKSQLVEAGLEQAAEIETRCLSGLLWMSRMGVAFDRGSWQALGDSARIEAERVKKELDGIAPTDPDALFGGSWSWDSPEQVRQALALAGCPIEDTADESLAKIGHPLAELLRQYRHVRKQVSNYGCDWLKHVASDGRVYPTWKQMGCASGRMSCREPNMQQLPRGDYRRCVVAPPGRVLVKADYSQIELRIAAKVSGDKALLEAYKRGEDLHTSTARRVLGIQHVSSEHRQLAKALNFGLLYGMGAAGFAVYAKAEYSVDLTPQEASRFRSAFFRSYPGLAAWHRKTGQREAAVDTRTLVGRRRLAVQRFTEKLNTPVQGTGADGLKMALALLWERRADCPGAFPVLVVHDEIVVEADADRADVVAGWLKNAMVDAMHPFIAPVPVEVETKAARTWGGN
jgi:DNA polymerase-1